MKFIQKLEQRQQATDSLVCVGIDPVLEKLPSQFQSKKEPFFEFGKWIIDQTNKYACAYKPNSAYYESLGSSGIDQLKKTCDYLKQNYPDIPIIIDAKRGDIGHTNQQYAKFIFEYLGADSVTLQPYLGSEALSEFFKYKDKGLILLCRTSNPGAGEFQDLLISVNEPNPVKNKLNLENKKIPLWQKVATQITTDWQKKSVADLLLVVGATYPKELKVIRKLAPKTTFLIPGIGKQGGNLEKTLLCGLNSEKKGVIINSSRGIIYSNNPKEAVKSLFQAIKNNC